MTTQQFFDKYNGRFVDYDGAFGAQCVDVMRQYCRDVLGIDGYIAIPQTGWAKNIFNKFSDNKYFTKILNGPYNFPQEGDLVFWGTYPLVTGLAGHVAVCSRADAINLLTFDQNYGNPKSCKFIKHSYKGILGWFAPKK